MSSRKVMTVMLTILLLLAAATAVSAQEQTYIVKAGDRLSRIAQAYGVPMDTLVAYNNIANPNRIYTGQVIRIPAPGYQPPVTQPPATGYVVYIVDRGDTLREIATKCGTTWQHLAQVNNIPNANQIAAGMRLLVPNNGCSNAPGDGGGQLPVTGNRLYTVQPGDYLSLIAQRYNVTVASIRALNNLYGTTIYPGQRLLIPPASGPVVVPPTQPPPQIVNGYYQVRYGDTMLKISRWFGVDVWNLARANGIYNLNHIYAGQYLRVPGY